MSEEPTRQDDEQPQEDLEVTEEEAAEVTGGVESAVSNIMKTKHDTVKNAINNIR